MQKQEKNINLDMKCLHGFKIIPDASSLEVMGNRLNKIGEGFGGGGGPLNSPSVKVQVNTAIQLAKKS